MTNLPEYDAALRQRGSLTVWFTEEAIAAWRAEPRTTRGGQPHYSALAITTGLTVRAVFRLALRQTEGLSGSFELFYWSEMRGRWRTFGDFGPLEAHPRTSPRDLPGGNNLSHPAEAMRLRIFR